MVKTIAKKTSYTYYVSWKWQFLDCINFSVSTLMPPLDDN
jgi:hypothetical protein